MPNFARLALGGIVRRLTTSIPPQSPVAWSNLITGMNAGGHGISILFTRPETFQLYFSTSKVEGPKHSFHLGSWVIPLGSGSAEQLRHGKAFWRFWTNRTCLIMFTGFRQIPSDCGERETLSGMGTPICAAHTARLLSTRTIPTAAAGAVEGGEVVQVEVKENRVDTHLIGPDNTFGRTRRLRLSRLRWMWTHWRRWRASAYRVSSLS